jgi:polyisoprenoid-binding protein YceI
MSAPLHTTLHSASLPAGTWEVDTLHSSIGFAVKHWGVSTFRGTFPSFSGSIETKDGRIASVAGTVEIGSLVVGDPTLDGHLRSEDFFAVEAFPRASFRSTALEVAENGSIDLSGHLTIREVTLPTTLRGSVDGVGVDAYGITRLGLSFEGTIDRTAFGVDWNAEAESGAAAVANEVSITLQVEATLEGGEGA